MSDAFEPIFARIRDMLAPHAAAAVAKADAPGSYHLDTHETRAKDGYRTYFGGVEIKKQHVSAHLFPVYTDPALLDDISPALKKRMQGKSCFNFKTMDDTLLSEFETLVTRSADLYRAQGRLR